MMTNLVPTDPVTIALFVLGAVLYFLLTERLLARFFPAPGEVAPDKSPGAPTSGGRRLAVIRALVAVAPLLGLLGTVRGMMQVFRGLPGGPVSLTVAEGIRAALYSTEYGLALALPAFLLSCLLR